MGAKAHELDDVPLFVYPYQQEVVSNVALHASSVVCVKFVWGEFWRYRNLTFQHFQNVFQGSEFLLILFVPFKVFTELCCRL